MSNNVQAATEKLTEAVTPFYALLCRSKEGVKRSAKNYSESFFLSFLCFNALKLELPPSPS